LAINQIALSKPINGKFTNTEAFLIKIDLENNSLPKSSDHENKQRRFCQKPLSAGLKDEQSDQKGFFRAA